jgi:hypothetical protein
MGISRVSIHLYTGIFVASHKTHIFYQQLTAQSLGTCSDPLFHMAVSLVDFRAGTHLTLQLCHST